MKRIIFITISLLSSLGTYAQNKDISGGTVWESEPYMILDPADPQHIVVAWMGALPLSGNLSIKTTVSTNGGATWSIPVVIPHILGTYTSADVSMAYDHLGELFLTFIDYHKSTDSGGVYIVMSADGGLTWSTPSLVINGMADSPKEPLDRPWFSIGKTSGSIPDTLYVTTKPAPWIAPPNRPYFTMSYNKGISWSSWRYLDTTGFLVGNVISAPMAAPATDSAGVFHCIYPTYTSSLSVYPRYILASHVLANSFTYNTAYTVIGAGSIDTLAKAGHRFICDPSNNSHYAMFTIQNLHGDLDVFSTETFDAGTTWSAQQRVNDDAVGNGKMQDLVWSNFDEHGNIIAAWRDRRDASGTGYQQPSEIWGAVKWKDSAIFSANFKISDTVAPYDSIYLSGSGNDFMNVAMAQDTMSAVWGDVRTGVLNIWFERRNMLTGSTIIKNIVHEQLPMVKLYPLPVHNSITIEGDGIDEVTLYDLNGGQVFNKKINSPKTVMDISKLPVGVYVAKVITKYGVVSEKISKE